MEKEFYRDEFAVVTNTRFMTNGETHALSGITSVSRYIKGPSLVPPSILVLIGLMFLYRTSGVSSITLGLASFVLAVIIRLIQKPSYIVAIRTAAGEIRAITDQNAERVDKIISALNQAIVSRG